MYVWATSRFLVGTARVVVGTARLVLGTARFLEKFEKSKRKQKTKTRKQNTKNVRRRGAGQFVWIAGVAAPRRVQSTEPIEGVAKHLSGNTPNSEEENRQKQKKKTTTEEKGQKQFPAAIQRAGHLASTPYSPRAKKTQLLPKRECVDSRRPESAL